MVALIIFVAVVLGFGWAFSESLPFSNEVTVYEALCTGTWNERRCKGEERTAGAITYRALADQQTIIYWYNDGSAPKRLTDCAVRDARNWSCPYDSAHPEVKTEMVNGEIVEPTSAFASELLAKYRRVSKWYWWLVRITEKR